MYEKFIVSEVREGDNEGTLDSPREEAESKELVREWSQSIDVREVSMSSVRGKLRVNDESLLLSKS